MTLALLERRATVKYDRAIHEREVRYIHKYYLPQELKPKIFVADILGVHCCFADDEECNLWRMRIPAALPACVIQYEDLGLEKRIDGDSVRKVLVAYAKYIDDCRAELTLEETRSALNLNAWLRKWEKQLLAQQIMLIERLERRVRSNDSWMTDYEIDLEISFYIRDDDPFSEEKNPEGSEYDVDCDPALLCNTHFVFGAACAEEAPEHDYWGLGDQQAHNDPSASGNPIYQLPHCTTFHDLYDHQHIPMKHMGRVGRVYADFVIRYQHGISVDLTGEEAVTVKDEPRIRERIALR